MDHRQSVATLSPQYHHHHHHPYYPYQLYHGAGPAAPAYRQPLHFTWQHQQLPIAQVDHQHQYQASLAGAGFQSKVPTPQTQVQLPLHVRRHTHPLQQQQSMATFQPQPTDEEIVELQKLSNEYEPEASGPLVGQRQPSTAITTEYASADPVFQAKTAALPQKYSHYRTIRGDGKCGWRAVAFGYFEVLIHLGDGNKFLEEETRLRSLSNVINAAGYQPEAYDEFADETFDLLRKLANCLMSGDAEEVLLSTFNDEYVSNYIITHLKILTSAWMKTHSQDYASWLITQSVDEYCDVRVMPISSEIDSVSLSALKDVFVSPAGMTLEVLYLDRSPGNEVNMHRFSPVNHGGFDTGTIRLLYRPGHYDLLYMVQDIPQVSMTTSFPTFLQYASQPHHELIYDVGVPDALMSLPGMSMANVNHGWMTSSLYNPETFAAATPAQQGVQANPIPVTSTAQPVQMQAEPAYVPSVTATQLVPPPNHLTQELAIRTMPQAPMSAQLGFQHQLEGPFRASLWTLKRDMSSAAAQMPLQTPIFRNSHFNTAHFLNAEFQPEQWHPDDDYITPSNKTSRQRISR